MHSVVAISTGVGLSPGQCLLPHIGGGPDVYEKDMFCSKQFENPQAALLSAPTTAAPPHSAETSTKPTSSRRSVIGAVAASASVMQVPRAANAATNTAVDLVVEVGDLSLQARQLQLYVRNSAPVTSGAGAVVRQRVSREIDALQRLLAAMENAAPNLRICAPAEAGCDCVPDAKLMATASLQVDVVREQVARLRTSLADPKGFDELVAGGGAIVYPGGAVERALETLVEASDLYLDLAAGRPLMTARLAPLRASKS